VYISQFDEDLIRIIKPASRNQIFRLKELLIFGENYKFELPKPYEVFLENMGANDGGLLSDVHCVTYKVEEMIEHNESYRQNPSDPNKEIYLTILQSFYSGEDFAFNFRGKQPENVIMTDRVSYIDLVSENFEKLLFQTAFYRYQESVFSKYFTSSCMSIKDKTQRFDLEDVFEIVLETATTVAKNYRLSKAWFSDFNNFTALGQDICFEIKRSGETGAAIGSVRGYKEEMVNEILDIFVTALGLRVL